MKYIDRKKYKINVTINVFIFGANYIYFTVAFFNIIKKIIVVTTCMVIVVNIIITFIIIMITFIYYKNGSFKNGFIIFYSL